jgi:hypothetical protein
MKYFDFLESKRHYSGNSGFNPVFMPKYLFDFQSYTVDWALNKGRSAVFADCGMGKTIMQLVWAQNIIEKTNKPVLILSPLAVSFQTQEEATKFSIDSEVSIKPEKAKIYITNYEKLSMFNPDDFAGVVCDESSILKNFNGAIKSTINGFMRKTKYRLLCTATAAPNDFIEFGTSSEALGYLGHMDMLNRFFKNQQNNSALRSFYGEAPKWRFRGHSELKFWQWLCSWALAYRKPSDIGFNDKDFILKPMHTKTHFIENVKPNDGMMFSFAATRLPEQRAELKATIKERCGLASELVKKQAGQSIVWCHLNEEADYLKKAIGPDCVEVSGKDSDDKKIEKFFSFTHKKSKVLITKPKIGAWGLNFQNCAHVVYFPSHSYEQYYQAIRRCWRFGQKNEVNVDVITTPGGEKVLDNLRRKSDQAIKMFDSLVSEMNNAKGIKNFDKFTTKQEVPSWL